MEEALYRKFYEVEERHWWFVSRQRIIRTFIDRFTLPVHPKVLDVGCGTGAFLKGLPTYCESYGTDTSPLAIQRCRERGLTNVFECTLERFPKSDLRFDIITLLDVIEHVEDDQGLVRTAADLLAPGGTLMITVPAYQFLWSHHDEINHHKRRYSKHSLLKALQGSGLNLLKISYFNTVLFPLALLQRTLGNLLSKQSDRSLEIPPSTVNSVLEKMFSAERFLLPLISFPFGLSLLAILRKNT